MSPHCNHYTISNFMKTKKKLKEYFDKGVRKLRHRKGFGVHSPYAYSIITEVIEEKLPYYAYQRMKRSYGEGAPIPLKTAWLLFRLANRVKARRIVEVGADGGYSLLPLILVDSRTRIFSQGDASRHRMMAERIAWVGQKRLDEQVQNIASLSELPDDYQADMLVVNALPSGMSVEEFNAWLLQHMDEQSLIFMRGILPGHPLEQSWDQLCDLDEVSITMDLYDYGLAIRKPRFFKQHYIVSF